MGVFSYLRNLVTGSSSPDSNPESTAPEDTGAVTSDPEPDPEPVQSVPTPEVGDYVENASYAGVVSDLAYAHDTGEPVVRIDGDAAIRVSSLDSVEFRVSDQDVPSHEVFGIEAEPDSPTEEETPDHPVFESEDDTPDHEVFA